MQIIEALARHSWNSAEVLKRRQPTPETVVSAWHCRPIIRFEAGDANSERTMTTQHHCGIAVMASISSEDRLEISHLFPFRLDIIPAT
jgi:hypothetical protein